MYHFLDVTLFLRANAKKLDISPIEQAILYAMAGRIGKKKKYTWVKQDVLCDELNVSRSYLSENIASLVKKNLLIVGKREDNKQCNTYTLGECIVDLALEKVNDLEEEKEPTDPNCTKSYVRPSGHDQNITTAIADTLCPAERTYQGDHSLLALKRKEKENNKAGLYSVCENRSYEKRSGTIQIKQQSNIETREQNNAAFEARQKYLLGDKYKSFEQLSQKTVANGESLQTIAS